MSEVAPLHTEARLVIVVGLALLAGWLGLQRYRSQSRSERPRLVATGGANASASWHFRNGRWVQLEPAQLVQVARDLARRTPGLVRIAGTVWDREGSSPVAGAEVVFVRPTGEVTITTGAHGRYSLEIPPGFYRQLARLEGYLTVVAREGDEAGALPLVGFFRDHYGVDIEMWPQARVSGTLFDEAGEPMVGAMVSARPRAGGMVAAMRPALGTDVAEVGLDGSFVLDVAAGGLIIDASRADYGGLQVGSTTSVQLDPGEQAHLDLTMTRGCVVTGRVVDSRGQPLGAGLLHEHVGGLPPDDFAPVGEIDASGRFRFASPRARVVELRAWPWRSAPSRLVAVDCREPRRHDGLELVVPETAADAAGRLVSATGVAMVGAVLDLQRIDAVGVPRQERTDEDGRWAFYGLASGNYQLTAFVAGAGAVVSTIAVPGDDVDLVLGGTGALMGTVQGMREGAFTLVVDRCRMPDRDGGHLDEVSMPTTTVTVRVERGEYRVDGLPACPLEARARTPYRTVRFTTTIFAGEVRVRALDLRQPVAKRISGVVVDHQQAPLSGVSVLRVPDSGAPRSSLDFAITDSGGHYELRAYSGDRLLFNSAAGAQASARVPWSSAEVEQIDAKLSRS